MPVYNGLALLRHFGHSESHAGCHIIIVKKKGEQCLVEEHPQLPSGGVQRVNELVQCPS